MTLLDRASPLQFAIVGFLAAVVVAVVVERFLFEGDIVGASITAVGIGSGVGIGFYVVRSASAKTGP